MIPKIIHCSWFSSEKKPPIIENCKESWEKILTNYEMIEWNSKNFDVNISKFAEEAFSAGKWAFVSDYLRLWALYKYGGIYLDYDVCLNRDLSLFLDYNLIFGWESLETVGMHMIGAEKGNELIKLLLDSYKEKHFYTSNGKLNLTPITKEVTSQIAKIYKIKFNGKRQIFGNNYAILPMNILTVNVNDDKNICDHHFLGSWDPNHQTDYKRSLVKHYYRYYNKWYSVIFYNIKKRIYHLAKLIMKKSV